MKKNRIKTSAYTAISILLLSCINTQLFAQRLQKKCNTNAHEQLLKAKDPNYAAKRQAYLEKIEKATEQNSANRTSQQTFTIPVVVHVVYKNADENLSDAQIQSQIDVLNEDFNFLNADTINIPTAFKPLAGNVGVYFCLAKIDPSGNATTGIERRAVTTTPQDDDVKTYANGGLDAWDVKKYLNIWVSDLGSGDYGYAELPVNQYSNTYGISINYTAFGRIGNIDPYANKGRTTSHEMGHALNLEHLWGNNDGILCGDDHVADTPPAKEANYDCPTFPYNANSSCGADANGEMFMNYMDYTTDACMCLFTKGQVARMLAVLTNPPYNSLTTSTVCTPLEAGISKKNNILTPIVFPNPTTGLITLNNLQENSFITITDILGRQVLKTFSNSITQTLDLSLYTKGIYIVTITSGMNTSSTKLMIE